MLLTPQQIEALRRIIRDASVAVAITTFGLEVPDEELQRLVREGWVRAEDLHDLALNAYEVGRLRAIAPDAATWSFERIRQHLAEQPAELTPAETAAVDHARARAGEYCVALGNRAQGEVELADVEIDQAYAEKLATGIKTETSESLARRESVGELRTRLRQMSEDWSRDWDRIAVTESHLACEEGLFDALEARYEAQDQGEPMMAKVPEPTACDDCRRLYLDGRGRPMIRPASWWRGNGDSNVGRKKKAEWQAVYGAMHPFCQCRATEVPRGFAFDESWDLVPESMAKGRLPLVIAFQRADLRKAVLAARPPGQGWAPIPHGKHGGFRRRGPDGEWDHWYPSGVPGHRQHLEISHAEHDDRVADLRPRVKLGGEYERRPGDYSLVMPDPSEPGKVRIQNYDRSGFFGHRTYATLEELLDDNAHDQWKLAPGTLDAFAAEPEWAEGMARALVMQVINRLPSERQDERRSIERAIEEHGWAATADALGGWAGKGDLPSLHKAHRAWRLHKARRLARQIVWRGLPISIETDAGEVRHWYDPHEGRHGQTLVLWPYGYVRGTEGADGDQLDVYVGPDEDAKKAYVVHQRKGPEFTRYDEDKCMLGFPTWETARRAYLAHYDDPRFLGSYTAVPVDLFVQRARDGSYRKGKRIAKGGEYPGSMSDMGALGTVGAGAWAMQRDAPPPVRPPGVAAGYPPGARDKRKRRKRRKLPRQAKPVGGGYIAGHARPVIVPDRAPVDVDPGRRWIDALEDQIRRLP